MDEFGDRMKEYEGVEAKRRFLPMLPVMARIDGKRFSRWTQELRRPYDERLSTIMASLALWLTRETNAVAGYTQSDEITLCWYSDEYKSQIWFDGRVSKMTSVLSSMATINFDRGARLLIPEKVDELAFFDCRIWQVPNLDEAANTFLWRELDATKNSVSMAVREFYSHQELQGVCRATQMDMLMEKGVNWNDYPAFFKRGAWVVRRHIKHPFSAPDLEGLSAEHIYRRKPPEFVERTTFSQIDMPPFGRVTNRVGVLFREEEPVLAESSDE